MTPAGCLVSTILAAVVAAIGLTACGGDQPPICDDVDTLQASVDNLKDVQVSENGLNALSADLGQVQQDVRQLVTDAKAEFGDEASKVAAAVQSLQSSVHSARSEPNATTLSVVGTAVQGVDSSLSALQDAVSDTC
jgi:ABC-type phosphate transport system auxiliary subunit